MTMLVLKIIWGKHQFRHMSYKEVGRSLICKRLISTAVDLKINTIRYLQNYIPEIKIKFYKFDKNRNFISQKRLISAFSRPNKVKKSTHMRLAG